jgi:uncharacterized protein (DUF608 family)
MRKVWQSESFFPRDLPEREWVEFHADGFSRPVTGVVFRRGSVLPGMPLGALGTGFISLGTDGTLDYYSTIFNAFMERHVRTMAYLNPVPGENADLWIRRPLVPTKRLPFLGLAVGGRTWVLTTRDVTFRIPELSRTTDIQYWGHYPVADLQFETGAPVEVNLRAWVPFLPGCAVESNTPGAVFEVRLRNATRQVQEGTVALSFHGPREYEAGGRAEYVREDVRGTFSGVVVRSHGAPNELSYALGVIEDMPLRCGGELTGIGWRGIASELPRPRSEDGASSIAVDFQLQPRACRTIRFALVWYAPFWQAEGRVPFPDGSEPFQPGRRYITHSRLLNMYAARFRGALDVARYLAGNHERLLSRILAWQQVVYSEEKIPGWLRDSLVNIFHVLAQESFWVRNEDSSHWWGAEGFFGVDESLIACPQVACMANDQSGEWPVNLFFPELARNKLRCFKRYQKESGQTPSTLGPGCEPDECWYDQQLTVDGQAYVHMVDRIWQATGDDSVLEEFYTSVRNGLRFMQTVDADGDGLLEVLGNNQYYDYWPTMAGPAVHISGYWLATLRIGERMARKVGDDEFAAECADWFKRGSRSLERKLWNERTGSYLVYHQPETGARSDSILSDQLIGQWFAHLHGLPRVFPEEKVRTVLETIWSHNVKAASFGVRTAVRPDLSADREGFYSQNQCPSYSTLVPAMVMIWNGDRRRGLELIHSVWRKMVLEKSMAWDMPCQLTPEGEVAFGLEYYHNTMLWTLPAAIFGHDIARFRSPEGLVGRIVAAASFTGAGDGVSGGSQG